MKKSNGKVKGQGKKKVAKKKQVSDAAKAKPAHQPDDTNWYPLRIVLPFPVWDNYPFQIGAWRNIIKFFSSLSVSVSQSGLYSDNPEYASMSEIERLCAIYLKPASIVKLHCKDPSIVGRSVTSQISFMPDRSCYIPCSNDLMLNRTVQAFFKRHVNDSLDPPWYDISAYLLQAGHSSADIIKITSLDALKLFEASLGKKPSLEPVKPYVTFSKDYRTVYVGGVEIDRFAKSAWAPGLFKALDEAQKHKDPDKHFVVWEDYTKDLTSERTDPGHVLGRRNKDYKAYLEIKKETTKENTVCYKIALKQNDPNNSGLKT